MLCESGLVECISPQVMTHLKLEQLLSDHFSMDVIERSNILQGGKSKWQYASKPSKKTNIYIYVQSDIYQA